MTTVRRGICGEQPADLVGGAAGRDGHGHARLDQRCGRARDGQLGLVLEGALGVEAGLVHGRLAQQRGAAVDLDQVALALERLEVAAHGHVRDAELAHQVRDAHGPIGLEPLEDVGVALRSQHWLDAPSAWTGWSAADSAA